MSARNGKAPKQKPLVRGAVERPHAEKLAAAEAEQEPPKLYGRPREDQGARRPITLPHADAIAKLGTNLPD